MKTLKKVFRIPERWPSFKQLKNLPQTLNRKEKIVTLLSLYAFIFSSVFLIANFYYKRTTVIPRSGGTYIEGVVGNPRFINPIYSPASDVDRDLTELVFSGLAKYETTGEIIPDLAESIKQQENLFEINLRDNLFWSDGERITADDVIFTIRTIQDPDYKSPLRPDWIGVGVEKVSDLSLNLILEEKSVVFWNKLTIKIIPKHIWENVTPQNFPLSNNNINPIGSGPFKVKEVISDSEKITAIKLIINDKYHGKKPFIEDFTFLFFKTREDLISEISNKKITGFSVPTFEDYKTFLRKFTDHIYIFPRYFAIFFNNDNAKLSYEMREALNFATDKDEILTGVLNGKGKVVNSPVLNEVYNYGYESDQHDFNIKKASEILDELGFVKNSKGIRVKKTRENTKILLTKDLESGSQGEEVRELQRCLIFLNEEDPDIYPEKSITGFYGSETKEAVIMIQEKYADEVLTPWGFSKGTGMVAKKTREKLNELCSEISEETEEISLTITTVNQSLTFSTAEMIKEQWEKVGIKVNIEALDLNDLERDVIKPRKFEALIFGKAFESIPDFFPFWHSSQKTDLGLNLSMFESEKADKLLEEIRKEFDSSLRAEKIMELEKIINDDIPAVFLYNPDFLYLTANKIKGINSGMIVNPSFRFLDVQNWYIKTKRIWN